MSEAGFVQECYFFGTFNPIHVGHLMIAQAALNQFCNPQGIERVTFVPAGNPPHRQEEPDLAPVRDRLKMVRLATQGNPRFRVSNIELHYSSPTYTVDVLSALCGDALVEGRKAPIIIGADAFQTLGSWHESRRLLEMAFFIQAPRPYSLFSNEVLLQGCPYLASTQKLDMPEMEISATWIRQQLRNGQDLRYLIAAPVLDYIRENRLYPP